VAISEGKKLSELEADNSNPPSAEVKYGGAIPLLPIRLLGIMLK
jgi:hypothetical protein